MVTTKSRPRLRDVRWHSKSSFAAIGLSVVVLALLQTKDCSAFALSLLTTTPLRARGPATTAPRQVGVPVQALAGVGRTTRGSAASHCVGCAALILACVARKVQSGMARKPGRDAALCRAAPVFAVALDVAGKAPAVLHTA
eukprot:CAMPEP_0204578304 /NCGR_PEP_ID=MMETSP0661-20131031/42847_1 /ASSEMBLY_ACC=CAM_ASM_000606 /TAXON_ID=109239 /ORGANISM="Alexandrium margalefi, Strain AMGDE01CS-322" /LENGTH=140 /DNA_ID=CAMNT_0051587225 /DNA_START=62 /DNA_END=481 /DNA_ORIENTATION=+